MLGWDGEAIRKLLMAANIDTSIKDVVSSYFLFITVCSYLCLCGRNIFAM